MNILMKEIALGSCLSELRPLQPGGFLTFSHAHTIGQKHHPRGWEF